MDEELGKTFGIRMRSAREEKGMSQEQLAAILDTGKSSISQWENGVNLPKLKQALAICNIFKENRSSETLGTTSNMYYINHPSYSTDFRDSRGFNGLIE